MQRTSADGSFEREILKVSSLQDGVPLAEEVRYHAYTNSGITEYHVM